MLADNSDVNSDPIYRAGAAIRSLLGKKRRRDAAVALFEHLAPRCGRDKARSIALRLLDTEPRRLLSASEALQALAEVNIRRGRLFLLRLARKLQPAKGSSCEIWMDRDGHVSTAEIAPENAFVKLRVVNEQAIRFEVEPLNQNS